MINFGSDKTIPKGKLIAIGGNEDKGSVVHSLNISKNYVDFDYGILKRVLLEMKGKDSRIEVVTTASEIPEEVGENYLMAFQRLQCNNVGLLHISERSKALDSKNVERIKQADGVMFSGGDQSRLSAIYSNTEFLDILQERYLNEDFVIAGTSAGAMAMSHIMISESVPAALLKGNVKMSTGLGFIDNAIIDSHFDERGRFGRLAQVVADETHRIGIGLGEDTGVLITKGNKLETIGSGLVIVIDGHEIKHSNIDEVEDGFPLSIENLTVHILARGNCYLLDKRKFFADKCLVEG